MSGLSPDQLFEIFETKVLPYLETQRNPEPAPPGEKPWFVSVGGQPGAGKSWAIEASGAEHAGSVIVNGDDLRRFHPDYEQLMTTDSLAMPEVTAQLSGALVQLASQWLRENQISAVIETTLRQKDFLIAEFATYKEAGYATELRVVAVPLEVSRLGILARYVGQAQRFGAGRAVSLQGHDGRAVLVPETVEGIVAAGLVDRLVIQDRNGNVLDVDASAGGSELAALARAIVDEHRAPSSLTLKQAQGWFTAAATTIAALQGLPVAPDILGIATRLAGIDAEAIAPIAWLESALQQEQLAELHLLLKVVTRARTTPRVPPSQRLRRTPSQSVPELEL